MRYARVLNLTINMHSCECICTCNNETSYL